MSSAVWTMPLATTSIIAWVMPFLSSDRHDCKGGQSMVIIEVILFTSSGLHTSIYEKKKILLNNEYKITERMLEFANCNTYLKSLFIHNYQTEVETGKYHCMQVQTFTMILDHLVFYQKNRTTYVTKELCVGNRYFVCKTGTCTLWCKLKLLSVKGKKNSQRKKKDTSRQKS